MVSPVLSDGRDSNAVDGDDKTAAKAGASDQIQFQSSITLSNMTATTKTTKIVGNPIKQFWENKTYLRNLLCMVIVFISSSFGYYLIGYELKYIKGNLYINSIVSSISEFFAYMFSGVIFR